MEKVVTFSQKGNGEPKIDYLVRMMIDQNALEKKTEKNPQRLGCPIYTKIQSLIMIMIIEKWD